MIIFDPQKFGLHFSSRLFEKNPEKDVVDYDFHLSFEHILKSFSKHYNHVMVNERECYDEDDGEDYEDFYISLQKLKFPDLDAILKIDRN